MGEKMSLENEEYVEQTYFFRVLRERISQGLSTQEILESLDQEILSTTKLPMAIGFLRSELKHSGNLSGGFERLAHYFSAFQAHVMRSAENDRMKFSIHNALSCLEKEALYRSGKPTQSGLFIYQFEVLARNRLGYEDGLNAIAKDRFYPKEWQEFISDARNQLSVVDFADLVYLRSEWYVIEQRRKDPAYDPSLSPLFGEKEGKIAGANRNRDPLYLFAALQRQLGYPEVPRYVEKTQEQALLTVLQSKVRDLEGRIRLLEQETKGHVDLAEFAKPQLLRDDNEDE